MFKIQDFPVTTETLRGGIQALRRDRPAGDESENRFQWYAFAVLVGLEVGTSIADSLARIAVSLENHRP